MLGTSVRLDGDEYLIDGAKRWIGNGSVADVVVVWARGEDGQVGGYLVEKRTPGYDARVIEGKGSLRYLAGAHHARRRPRPGREPAPWRPQLQGRRAGARRHPLQLRVVGARPRRGRVRDGVELRQTPSAVRQAPDQLPDSGWYGCWPK